MERHEVRRGRRASAAAVLAIAFAVTGCAAPQPVTTPAAVGDCYLLTVVAEVDAVSVSGPAVDCSAPHTAQVFARPQVTGPDADEHRRPSVEALRRDVSAWCSADLLRSFLGAGEVAVPLSIRAYFPTRELWERGDRTISCAVSVTGADGSPLPVEVDLAEVGAGSLEALCRSGACAEAAR